MKLLIDADSFLYKVGFALENDVDWGDGVVHKYYNPQAAKTAMQTIISDIQYACDCKDYELWLTSGENFRDVNPLGYKQNREGMRKPAGFNELKQYMFEELGAKVIKGIEADDVVVYKKTTFPDDYILVAQDKDVLYQTEGTHYNYNKKEFITVDKKDSIKFKYYQTLTGDTVDGYKGCNKIGPKKATKILDIDWKSERELWIQVLLTYRAAGMKRSDAINTMRLADMHQWDGTQVNLFDPKKLRHK